MKAHILIIDDDDDHRDILSEALAYYNFKVEALRSGEGLKQVLMRFKPALLLTDYQLPGENGIELVKKIKNEFEMPELPVILMSAYLLDEENLKDCDYILHKPFDLDILIEHVNALLPSNPGNISEDQVFE